MLLSRTLEKFLLTHYKVLSVVSSLTLVLCSYLNMSFVYVMNLKRCLRFGVDCRKQMEVT